MPAFETVYVVDVLPPPQLNVAPAVVDEAVNVWLVLTQVKTDGVAMLALGGVTVCVTVTAAVLVQPLTGSVTVMV